MTIVIGQIALSFPLIIITSLRLVTVINRIRRYICEGKERLFGRSPLINLRDNCSQRYSQLFDRQWRIFWWFYNCIPKIYQVTFEMPTKGKTWRQSNNFTPPGKMIVRVSHSPFLRRHQCRVRMHLAPSSSSSLSFSLLRRNCFRCAHLIFSCLPRDIIIIHKTSTEKVFDFSSLIHPPLFHH